MIQDRLGALPRPLCDESFVLLKRGVFDDPSIDVYVNSAGDFAFLSPCPIVDYRSYQPRVATLGLTQYKSSRRVIESRFAKIHDRFDGAASVLEVGAADGSFLAHIRTRYPDVALAAIEPDESTRPQRDRIPGLRQFSTLDEAAEVGFRADVICLFHVFEHLADPAGWLSAARRLLAREGRMIIEVPSLEDPLFSFYRSAAHREFYFQKQHPFVYSAPSLRRVLEHNGFTVDVIPYQRYGMENHLTWLSSGKPGGNAEFAKVFEGCDAAYKAALESRGLTDTIFAIAADAQ